MKNVYETVIPKVNDRWLYRSFVTTSNVTTPVEAYGISEVSDQTMTSITSTPMDNTDKYMRSFNLCKEMSEIISRFGTNTFWIHYHA